MLQWEHKVRSAHPGLPGRTIQSPNGPIVIPPKGPLRQIDKYMAKITERDWDAIELHLVDFWVKVCEVIPVHFNDAVPTDALWNRLVCLLDTVYGHITTDFWHGAEPPRTDAPVRVIATIMWAEEASRDAEPFEPHQSHFVAGMHRALAGAAGREPALSAIAKLRQWRPIELYVMVYEQDDTLRPLN